MYTILINVDCYDKIGKVYLSYLLIFDFHI